MEHKDIKDLMRAFDKSGLSKLKIKNDKIEVVFEKELKEYVAVSKEPAETVQASAVTPAPSVGIISENSISADTAKDGEDFIKSPMVGTFYKAPSPGASPFVKAGDSIKAGDTVAIIEAMKIMNEIEAEFDCKIIKVLVDDGEPVEYDQPLFLVEKL